MVTFNIVNCVVGTILILIFLGESCLSIDVTQNVHFEVYFTKQSSENNNQEQKQNVTTTKIFSSNHKWFDANTSSDTIKYQEIESAEDDIRWEDDKSLKSKERIVRQVSHGYSSLYPVLTTPYPNVNVNPDPYRPTAPLYEPMPYNNFNNYPFSNQNYFPNITERYPPYNPVSSRPPYYPPTQNLNYGNSSSFNQNLNQYNRSSYLNPNNLSSYTGQQNSFNNFPVSNKNYFPNTTERYPLYNPVSSRPPYYPPKQNFSYGNSPSFNQNLYQYNRTSYLNPNNLSSQTAQYNGFNNFPVSNQNYFSNTTVKYPPYNPASSRPPTNYPPKQNLNYGYQSFNQNPNQYNYSSNFYPNNDLSQNNASYQQHMQYYQNIRPGSIPSTNLNSNYNPNLNATSGMKAPWLDRNFSNTSGYGYSSYPSSFYPGNGLSSNGSQSRWPGYPINNGSYTNQSPYFS